MTAEKKLLNFLGIARKAGAISPGEFLTERELKGNRAYLVIVSAEASERTKRMFSGMGAYRKVPVYEFGRKEELGRAIGREFCAVLAVTQESFSAPLIRLLEENGGCEYESE